VKVQLSMGNENIPAEVKTIEDTYTYLNGIGYDPSMAFSIINYSLELQKINLQAKMLMKSEELASQELIERVAARVVYLLQGGMQQDAG